VTDTLEAIYLADITEQFRNQKKLADRALAQVGDADLFTGLDDESNSLAALVQHVAGNLLSRWKDFLTTDGEKPDRDRDRVFFADRGTPREALLARWEQGWQCAFSELARLTPEDLGKTVTIRAELHSVPKAIHRQLTHQAYHVGQIVMLAKHFAGPRWQTLSVPKGKSRDYNATMFARPQ
jgi:hypothetical protein